MNRKIRNSINLLGGRKIEQKNEKIEKKEIERERESDGERERKRRTLVKER
jgi:hypothetical protein